MTRVGAPLAALLLAATLAGCGGKSDAYRSGHAWGNTPAATRAVNNGETIDEYCATGQAADTDGQQNPADFTKGCKDAFAGK